MQQRVEFEDYVSINQILKILFKRKKLIIIGILSFMVLSFLFFLSKSQIYTNESILLVSSLENISPNVKKDNPSAGLSVPVFDGYIGLLNNKKMYKDFLKYNKYSEFLNFPSPFFKKAIQPIKAYNVKKNENVNLRIRLNFITGLRIIAKGKTPREALDKVSVLGKYVKSTLLNLQISDNFLRWKINLDTSITSKTLAIDRMKRKKKELERKNMFLIKKILAMAKVEQIRGQQNIINVDEKTEKYLTPRRQLIANKINLEDVEISIEREKRKVRVNQILLTCINKLFHNFDKKKSFMVRENLLEELKKKQNEFFKEKAGDEVKDASSLVKLNFVKFEKRRDLLYKFISNSKKKSKVLRIWKVIFISFVFSILFFFSLAIVLEWWKKNKDFITSSN